MDHSGDRYLHKKFKKQLSVDRIHNETKQTEETKNPPKESKTEAEKETPPSSNQVPYVPTESTPPQQPTVPDKATGGKYMCPYCNLACSKPSVLQKHIRAHTNERPYPCDSCGFSFKTRSNLYKHRRSRTHANRVMGNKSQETGVEVEAPIQNFSENSQAESPPSEEHLMSLKNKPYKPRFHTKNFYDNNISKENLSENNRNSVPNKQSNPDLLSLHINDIITKNNSIVNATDPFLIKKRPVDTLIESVNNQELPARYIEITQSENSYCQEKGSSEEPLNLTKNRKRCMSEVTEPVVQKSLIKELLLKNLYADTNMQCPHCKMIFQTVTELELHKLRCKGFTKTGAKYSRSSSVNVASILTQNKNAFDNIPQLQNTVFQLKSPGPFLGKTRLVENDKSKSFSFDDTTYQDHTPQKTPSEEYKPPKISLSPLLCQDRLKKVGPIKLFGGEVKIAQTSGEIKSFRIDVKEGNEEQNCMEFGPKVSENRVIVKSLQSGGTVSQGKPSLTNQHSVSISSNVFQMFEPISAPPVLSMAGLDMNKPKFTFEPTKSQDNPLKTPEVSSYTSIMDFSQKAVKLLAPDLKQIRLAIPQKIITEIPISKTEEKIPFPSFCNPMNLVVNGKVVRHVPGIPGPVLPEEPLDMVFQSNVITVNKVSPVKPNIKITPAESLQVAVTNPLQVKIPDNNFLPIPFSDKKSDSPKKELVKSPKSVIATTPNSETKKFARPNSLALKPTMSTIKQHHGLTPTMFNQILISPDTPRVAKKYIQHFLHGNYFSYLGLKSSTKSVYCTLNKTQPFYVPHFKKLSMYSEWRQQDNKADKLYVSAYDSRQYQRNFTVAGKTTADLVVHSSYKFVVVEQVPKQDQAKSNSLLGGYESNEDYTYIRGRGRGRYVCDQCGIRCKKPSMLKKHIRTHSNVRPYTCNHCNFSFKTKGNLTKHMKSKSHTRNYAASSSSNSSAVQSSTPSSESDTEDSGMDSSDESTRQHEAAYGLLSLSQKSSNLSLASPTGLNIVSSLASVHLNSPSSVNSKDIPTNFMNNEQIVHVNKTNYAKNKILDQQSSVNFSAARQLSEQHEVMQENEEIENLNQFLGKTNGNRTLTYPYTTILPIVEPQTPNVLESLEPEHEKDQDDGISQFHVFKKYVDVKSMVTYNPQDIHEPESVPNDLRKRRTDYEEQPQAKLTRIDGNDQVMDLSVTAPLPEQVNVPYDLTPSRRNNIIVGNVFKTTNEQSYSNIPLKTVKETNYEPFRPDENVVNYAVQEKTTYLPPEGMNSVLPHEYDNSAMETLADVATKQVKLEKNILAKNVASEFLKLVTKNEYNNSESSLRDHNSKEVNEIIVKSEENKSCTICAKNFNKPSQLRLHMNIHYLERPFRCDSCSVSFRTKGHLQKHERSASHHNKLSSSPVLSSSEPRPFKCSDCNIAFRIHGHLAKHLRSKMHIMKLECLAKIPFGLYAELERSNSLLTEINTTDGDQCLESLKMLAKKVFLNDPSKLNQLGSNIGDELDS